MSSSADPDESPVLGPPVDPPADVWANALAGALHDPRSPQDLADLLPVDDPAGVDEHGLDDAEVFDGTDDVDEPGDGADGAHVDPADPPEQVWSGDDDAATASDPWHPDPVDSEDGSGWLE